MTESTLVMFAGELATFGIGLVLGFLLGAHRMRKRCAKAQAAERERQVIWSPELHKWG